MGIDNIDLKELKKSRIKLLTTKNSHIEIVAEHAVAGALSLVKKLRYFNKILKKKFGSKLMLIHYITKILVFMDLVKLQNKFAKF